MNKYLLSLICCCVSIAAMADAPKAADPFAALDRDQDGRLSLEEARFDSALGRQFALLDANKDGFLSPMEFELGRVAAERSAQN
jgi:Ca2+-binding EF-hand superfamily protein